MGNIHSFLQNANGQHLDSIYLPSVSRYVLFKPITISLSKTITRIDMFKGFDINIELTKLSLFDELLAEDLSALNINSNTITELDYLSFMIGVRHLLSTELTFKCNCNVCKNEFTSILNQAQTIDPMIQNSKLTEISYERYDINKNLWKFDLKDYAMKDHLLFKHMINELKEIDEKNKDAQNNGEFIKSVLYIKNVYINDEKIDDWDSMSLIQKIKFFNNIPASVTINNSTGDCLYNFIRRTFAVELVKDQITSLKIICPSCKTEYHSVYNYDDMFFILGLPEDNQEIFKNIFNTEAQLIFNRWLTVSEINKMSYLDFKMYSEMIFNMEEERLKQEEEALKQAESDSYSF